MGLRGNEKELRDEMFRQLIERFKETFNNKFENLSIQNREIDFGIYFLIDLRGYENNRGDIHYEIFAKDWDVLLGLHFEGQNTRDEFRRRFEIKDDRFDWDPRYAVNKKISHKKDHNLNEEESQQIAENLVEMLEEMEESLGDRVRILASDILP